MKLFGRKKSKKSDLSAPTRTASSVVSKSDASVAKKEKSEKKKKKTEKKLTSPSVFSSLLLFPAITEKAYTLSEEGKYVFWVAPSADKRQIARAVSEIYSVKVRKVNILRYRPQNVSFRGRKGKTAGKKKAIVTLEPGEKIDLFE